jgi:hypothetical protein
MTLVGDIEMEAVKAYYDGRSFVPTKPILAKKNQEALVMLLDETHKTNPVTATKALIEKCYGMFKDTDLSSEEFAARKNEEKGLEL